MIDWQPTETAPRNGDLIEIQVSGRDELGQGHRHALPYAVRFHAGRWCYARLNTPLFYWHKPMRWRPWTRASGRVAA